MNFSVRPLHPTLTAEITGVDLAQPASPELAAQLEAANNQYPVLVFRGQRIDDTEQSAFAALYGPLETGRMERTKDDPPRTELGDISNIDGNGNVRPMDDRHRISGLADKLWHTDSSFKEIPAKYSMLYARLVPRTGHATEYVDLRAAYAALDDDMKERIEDLVASHSVTHSRSVIGFQFSETELATRKGAEQRVVRVHPATGEKTLYLASHASHIVGWSVPQGRSLLLDLIDHATQRQFVYRHEWQQGDLVWWDNRCTMHRARPRELGEPREMRRATVSDSASTLDQPRVLASKAAG